jgi:transcriptional regulator with GAF, ATPase, and Fis domain
MPIVMLSTTSDIMPSRSGFLLQLGAVQSGLPCIQRSGAPFVDSVAFLPCTKPHVGQRDRRRKAKMNTLLKDQLYKENLALREEIDVTRMFEEIVGSSPALQSVLAKVAKVAPTDSTVLIMGETGTGKELIARAIHKRSPRSARAFLSVNCAAIPRDLVASELFGHEKGAFTGATQRRLGRFESADGGTIFLDEVGELPLETQISLLRVLQEREFQRVGSNLSLRIDVRVGQQQIATWKPLSPQAGFARISFIG